MKKVLCLAMSLLMVCTLVACSGDKKDGGNSSSKKVGIVQIVDHASLNTIREAAVKEITDTDDSIEIVYKNANGDMSTLNTICQQFKDDGVDAIIAIATPSAMAAANVSKDIPVIFSAVSDPIGAKLVDSLEKPGGNITGTSDEVQVDQILALATEMLPETKSIGLLYNSGEVNSVSNMNKAKEYAKANGLEVYESAFANTADIQSSMQNLCQQADIVFTPNDNSVASAMDVVSAVANKTNTPLFVGADSMVADGGLATVGIDYTSLGKETGKMTIKVLNGTSPADIPVKVFKDNLSVYINTDVANKLNITTLDTIKKNHETVVEVK
ncbi:putative ABC transport system substrate-binding protein [Breznakia blatticola]|uniref:Putative ABC transport system substrate-binding protein n=1 Tax=Breznakia blatticola TaxID=1754012 RepID=A0A4R8A5X9_9FIRM|nr:ABC transporter substrate-binding protein [Breznakia blatticola]TDW24938.1 putative ABC transport system substrate-binding protein [Breznakia blatticola]